MRHLTPKGPDGSWKTGQRSPVSGWWVNQFDQVIHLDAGATFPPRVGSDAGNQVANWTAYSPAATGI